ncbi:MAG: tRNA-specific adenosine deaminase [Gammaproteobacteria bacterium]|nr:tRNA-specific adenosine deaminase [Gammaproteobacteria bacterium]
MDIDPQALMKLAYDQAMISESNGEVPVGAVYFDDNQVIAESGNVSITNHDPTGHAEIIVLRKAAKAKKNHRIGGTLVVTLEPCVMCMGAMIQARIETLIFGAFDPRSGAAGSAFDLSDSSDLNHKINVLGGVMENECKALMQNFFKSRR